MKTTRNFLVVLKKQKNEQKFVTNEKFYYIILLGDCMTIKEKLVILADSAKYDASCSSSGSNRAKTGLGSASYSGICHSFANDGRCISLLKILMTNCCIFDCKYCLNRKSNNVKRAIFTPEEICTLTINFYKRNYIEGLFLSSGIIKSPDYTMEKIIETVYLLRHKYQFSGYIHAKAIPGSSQFLVKKLGSLVDRISANIELPSDSSLKLLAPDKKSDYISQIMTTVKENRSRDFVPAGQSTQMIIGASHESDFDILSKSEALYNHYKLKRVFYSAYISVNKDKLLPTLELPPLKRENRLYQADWLLRFYNYKVDNLLDQNNPNFNLLLDPKADFALRNFDEYPKEVNAASYYELLKVPGFGPTAAKKIVKTRKFKKLEFADLKRMGISLKRAKYFITCNGKYALNFGLFKKNLVENALITSEKKACPSNNEQLRLTYE